MTTATPRVERFSQALHAFSTGDTEGWMEIFGDDAVHEMPFAPAGQPSRFEGKGVIAAHIREILSFIAFDSFEIKTLLETDDELIAELTSTGTLAFNDAPFTFDYVWIFSYRADRVSHFRDYMNPLQLPPLS
jgi:ketosteroid isomerase-like protein